MTLALHQEPSIEPDSLYADSTEVRGKQYMESEELQRLANSVIEEYGLEYGPAEIGFYLVYPNITKKKPARAFVAPPLVKFYSGNDFILLLSGEPWDMLDDDTRRIVMLHQLLHFEATYQEKKGMWKFGIRKPEYTDYYMIADKHGSDWHKTIQAVTSSLYDLEPKEESQISLF